MKSIYGLHFPWWITHIYMNLTGYTERQTPQLAKVALCSERVKIKTMKTKKIISLYHKLQYSQINILYTPSSLKQQKTTTNNPCGC